jgi:hypothetical protein
LFSQDFKTCAANTENAALTAALAARWPLTNNTRGLAFYEGRREGVGDFEKVLGGRVVRRTMAILSRKCKITLASCGDHFSLNTKPAEQNAVQVHR